MVIALFIWMNYTHAIWHKIRRRLPPHDKLEVTCGWRAVLELSRSMDAELLAKGIDVVNTTDRDARHKVRGRLMGGSVSLEQYQLPSLSLLSSSIEWLREEKWRACCFGLCALTVPAMVWVITVFDIFML